ncbi:MAG TPA: hypothetical protein VHC72_15655 [Bryobacteraceae bacterium]|nr:hypothetical protein [Bryobacteraceae bacterium]
MERLTRQIAFGAGCLLAIAGIAAAQGRGGGGWTTEGNDAQRTSSVPGDPNISVANMQKPGFRFLWKVKANNEARQGVSLSQALILDRYIGYRGFRSYAFFGGTSNNAVTLDTDLGRIEWSRHFDAPAGPAGTAACPGGMTAGVSRPTTLAEAVAAAAAGGGRGRGSGAQAAVGQPGEGAVQVAAALAAASGRGGRGGGRGRGGARPGPFPGNTLFAVTGDGMLRMVLISNGEDSAPPVRFLPANANATGLIFTEDDVFAATRNNCGGAPNGVWAMNLTDKTVRTWKTNGGSVVGTAFTPQGTIIASTADGEYGATSYSDSVVALDPKDLHMTDHFSPGKSEFTSAPVIFNHGGRDLVAVANKDGKIYLLDAKSLGGADHKTPLAASTPVGNVITGNLSTFEASGTRWILAPVAGGVNSATHFAAMNGSVTNGAVAAFKVVDQSGKPALEPAWVSRDLTNPLTSLIINGVVFATSGGNAQHPAVLYALDGSSGKELWNSGNTITSYSRTPVSGEASQMYLSTADSTIYTFGFELVK